MLKDILNEVINIYSVSVVIVSDKEANFTDILDGMRATRKVTIINANTSDELEGIINLQWEVADYFCGDWEELVRKCKGNATQHLENVLQLLEAQQELIESYQPHSKNHAIKKKRVIGLGDAKSTGAKGLEPVTDFSRAESSPPGFGGALEENQEKPTKKYKIKIKSDLDEKKRKKKRKKKKSKKKKTPNWGIYGGTYFDWGMYDGPGGGGDGGGGE